MTDFNLGHVVGADGAKGDTGNGIASISKTSTAGLVDTYTILFTDGTTTTFNVTNGSNASVTIQTSWGATLSDTKVPSEKLTKNNLDGKVDKVTGKGLSTEDYTSTEKTKLSGIETGANNYTHPSSKQCNYAPDLSNYVPKSDIVDNLTSTATNKPLSANQGKVLMDLIGDAITYINGTGGS